MPMCRARPIPRSRSLQSGKPAESGTDGAFFQWKDGLKLEVLDSPNSAGVVMDAIRCCKIALDRGISDPLLAPSSYFMKSPPQQFTDDEAHQKVEEFITG
jgi:hypothetical protein